MTKRQSAYAEILKRQQEAITPKDNQKTEESGSGQRPKSKSNQRVKITFYLEPRDQANHLDDIAEEFRKKTGVKINQQNLMRRIIEVSTIDGILP